MKDIENLNLKSIDISQRSIWVQSKVLMELFDIEFKDLSILTGYQKGYLKNCFSKKSGDNVGRKLREVFLIDE
jgi:hypothetical protein